MKDFGTRLAVGFLAGFLGLMLVGGLAEAGDLSEGKATAESPVVNRLKDRPRPVLGKVLELTDRGMVIKPQLPPVLVEKLRERGKEIPQLPDELEVVFSDQVRFVDSLEGELLTVNPFVVGDEVVVFGRKTDSGLVAFRVVDVEVARAYFEEIRQRIGERRERIREALREKFAWGKASIKEIGEGKLTLTSDQPELSGEFEIGDKSIFLVENRRASLDDFTTGQLVNVLIFKEKDALVMVADERTDFRRAMGRLMMAMARKYRQGGAGPGEGEHGWPKARLGRGKGK